MFSMTVVAGVMAGGALGGMLRAFATRAGARYIGERLPWGTLAANYTAASLLGALSGAMVRADTSLMLWGFVATGLLGGLSTVSSLAQQTLSLWQASRQRVAVVYMALSVGGGVALAAVGYGVAMGVSP